MLFDTPKKAPYFLGKKNQTRSAFFDKRKHLFYGIAHGITQTVIQNAGDETTNLSRQECDCPTNPERPGGFNRLQFLSRISKLYFSGAIGAIRQCVICRQIVGRIFEIFPPVSA